MSVEVSNILHGEALCDGACMTYTKEKTTILEALEQNPRTRTILFWSGNLWIVGSSFYDRIAQAYFYTTRAFIVYGARLAAFCMGQSHIFQKIFIPVLIAILLSFLSVLLCLFLNQARPGTVIREFYVDLLPECVFISLYYGLSGVVTAVFQFALLVAIAVEVHGFTFWAIAGSFFFIASVYLVGFLWFNLLLLLLDVRSALVKVKELIAQFKEQKLNISDFCSAREQIRLINKQGRWITSIILVPCVASLFGTVAVVLTLDTRPFRTVVILFQIANTILLLKEVFLMGIAFWYVAEVNGTSDELTLLLSRPSDDFIPDLKRMQMYNTCSAEPIGFELLYRRVSWSDVNVQITGFCVTIMVGIIKFLIGV